MDEYKRSRLPTCHSGCGWPAFDKCYKGSVATNVDNSYGECGGVGWKPAYSVGFRRPRHYSQACGASRLCAPSATAIWAM